MLFRSDPDNNGANDTEGILLSTSNIWNVMTCMYSPNQYFVLENSENIVYRQMSEGYKKALEFMNRLYNEKLCNDDIFTIKEKNLTSEQLAVGKTGISYEPSWASLYPRTIANNPEAEIVLSEELPFDAAYTNGAVASTMAWQWMVMALPKTCRNPEQALDLMEYLNSYDGRVLMSYGIKGVNYTELTTDENNDIVAIGVDRTKQNENWTGDSQHPLEWGLGNTIVGYADILKHKGNIIEALQSYQLFTSELEKAENPFYRQRLLPTRVLSIDPINGTKLSGYSKYKGRLDSINEEYRVKLVAGSPDTASFNSAWEEYIKAMNDAGATELVAEAVEVYNTIK